MFKCFLSHNKTSSKQNNFILVNSFLINNNFFLKKIWFFFIFLTGRIFRWVRFNYYMKLLLPDSNKPYLFFKSSVFYIQAKNKPEFIVLPIFFNDKHIINMLTKIRKQSIFNKRGFRIYNRIFFKKKGKVTTYITNK